MASQSQDIPVQPTLDIQNLSDEECLAAWASENKISRESMDRLFQEGFTSMRALKLIDRDDLVKAKLPRGQQKLIFASVENLLQNEALAQKARAKIHVDQSQSTSEGGNAQNSAALFGGNQDEASIQTSAPLASAHVQIGSGTTSTSGRQNETGDPYVRALLQQFRTGQGQNSGINSEANIVNGDSVSRQTLGGLGISDNNTQVNGRDGLLTSGGPSQPQSWRDPQIYLAAAATGKSNPTFYDITEFVTGSMEEEIVVGGNGAQQVVLKSGPKKPKLESVTLAQWSVANLAILYRLLGDGKLGATNILDYLSYTTKICQLVQRFNLVSVLLYDREYRKLQSAHNFRWGTDVPHLQSVHLQARLPKQSTSLTGKANIGGSQKTSTQGPFTADGRVICKLFNSKGGCHFKDCKFVHQCSQSGCKQTHSAVTHAQSKNM